MNWKNISLTTVVGALLLISAPAFADPPHWTPAYGEQVHRDYRHHRDSTVAIHERPHYVVRGEAMVGHRPLAVYRASPGMYQAAPQYSAPAPGYTMSYAGASGWGTIGGALTGALLGSQLGEGNGRVASMAVASVLGAYAGYRLATGH